MIGRRDRALLSLGFAGAFRRSELCALEVADGLRVLIRRSKGDQEGQGPRWPSYAAAASARSRPCSHGSSVELGSNLAQTGLKNYGKRGK